MCKATGLVGTLEAHILLYQLKAQGPVRTCNESKEEDEEEARPAESPLVPRTLDSRFRAKRERPTTLQGLLPESQGRNLAVTVLYVPY